MTLGHVSEVIVQLVIVVDDESIVMSVQFRRIESSETDVIVHSVICNCECEVANIKEEIVEEKELEKMKEREERRTFPFVVKMAP